MGLTEQHVTDLLELVTDWLDERGYSSAVVSSQGAGTHLVIDLEVPGFVLVEAGDLRAGDVLDTPGNGEAVRVDRVSTPGDPVGPLEGRILHFGDGQGDLHVPADLTVSVRSPRPQPEVEGEGEVGVAGS